MFNVAGVAMPREEMLDELSDGFPDKKLYNFDEQARYDLDRALLLERVLDGTFESYERVESELKFSYKITADSKFNLEVFYDEYVWRRSYDYVADAFEVAEAAYRLLVVYPRVYEEGAVYLEKEKNLQLDEESYQRHDHCQDNGGKQVVELIDPPQLVKGFYISATIHMCTDGNFLLSVIYSEDGTRKFPILDRFYSDPDLAELIADGYLKFADKAEFPHQAEDLYARIYQRVMH